MHRGKQQQEQRNANCNLEILRCRLAIDTYQCNLAIRECRNWKDALQLLFALNGRNARSDTVSFNSLRLHPWPWALQLHAQLRTTQLQPDVVTCGTTLSACDKAGEWRLALKMLDASRDVSGICLNSAMSALHREAKWQKCLEIFREFPLARLQPDTFFCNQWQITTSQLKCGPLGASGISYDHFLQSCAEDTRWAAALSHCCSAAMHRINPSVVGYSSVVTAFARDSQWLKALHWPQHMTGRSIEANVVTFNSLISACHQSDLSLWFAALSLISSTLDVGLQPSAVTFSTTLSAVSATRWPWTLALLSAAHAFVGANLYCLNSALTSINWTMILQLLQEMCSYQILPDSVSFNTLSAVSPWQQSLTTEASPGRDLFRSCSDNWRLALFSRDAPFVARVMETFGQWQRAIGLLLQVSDGAGTDPSDLILNCAIRACAEAHHWQVSVAILMSTSLATEISFNSAIGACAKRFQWQVALRLFEVMKHKGLVPNAVTYGSVLAAGEDHWDTSLHLLRLMSEASIRRDAFAYCSAVNACCRGQPWQLALQFYPNRQLEGHAVLCSTLIVACAEGSPQQGGAAWRPAVAMLMDSPTLLATNSVLKGISHDCDQSLSIFAWSPASCRDVTTYSGSPRS